MFAIGNANEIVNSLMFDPSAARADLVVEQLRISKLTADFPSFAQKLRIIVDEPVIPRSNTRLFA